MTKIEELKAKAHELSEAYASAILDGNDVAACDFGRDLTRVENAIRALRRFPDSNVQDMIPRAELDHAREAVRTRVSKLAVGFRPVCKNCPAPKA